MRPLDWRQLLTDNRVPFIERGPNVKRGEINIRCPFCGSADPSYHMGLNLDSGWWSCWRNKDQHSGKSPGARSGCGAAMHTRRAPIMARSTSRAVATAEV
jgi:hypothetical protein